MNIWVFWAEKMVAMHFIFSMAVATDAPGPVPSIRVLYLLPRMAGMAHGVTLWIKHGTNN
jgi:hypothetical protein